MSCSGTSGEWLTPSYINSSKLYPAEVLLLDELLLDDLELLLLELEDDLDELLELEEDEERDEEELDLLDDDELDEDDESCPHISKYGLFVPS